MITFNEIVADVANKEGKTLQEHVGNVRETVSIISDMMYEDPNVFIVLYKNGERRYMEEQVSKNE
jgi:hypothetical protein